ncbi:hypothetical protein AKJ35_00440 [candidate division MSBL1 archaeon SCGC-AAA833F18]|uniref:DUF371 domain-containing protein n=6 Tax=candidate division MSBL1 TaxID=215777 RepID=A0A133UZQ7_9EURY|nr:hypothetical protein AKJ42_02720 [candidate division MSBL1 archaeon SCGC-AAA261C02]KXB01868.1 hypothetical protein AKJ44_02005 [candidate division MSBL1 archaeon SCGC-AAA261F17]KXB03128.1 hypothetical protein AKJ47_02790 [candidate division MSBL1 archaeon SCGC-AAA261G05]KXB04645.1 hypothetical protein AKJ48_01875 [candidate division MSBL1 archaeon SCGC-AAA261O19]KXB09300.1 hypothetical protein AKJ46_00605 [candidate division MSBL1 archaeon SCGC-AAA833K04]KXB09613.1 hypothetical protein AKJ3
MSETLSEVVKARGHPKITARHSTTFMITKDEEIGTEADCVVGVKADKAAVDLKKEVKLAINSGASVEVTLEANDIRETIKGQGHPDLQLSDSNDLVIRESDYTCGRTLMIKADKAADDLSRDLIERLKNPDTTLKMTIKVIQ